MADNQAFYGFRPVTGGNGVAQVGRTIRMPVASNYDSNQANAVGTAGIGFRAGDVVNLLPDGTVKHCGVGTNATAANQPFGVVVSVDPWFDSTIGQNGAMRRADNLPAGVVYGTNLDRQSFLEILPMTGQVFEVDVNDATTATTQGAYDAFAGENVNLVYTAVAPKAFPRINISTHAGTATLQFRIIGRSLSLNNQDFSGANVKLLVTGNLVQQAPFNPTGI